MRVVIIIIVRAAEALTPEAFLQSRLHGGAHNDDDDYAHDDASPTSTARAACGDEELEEAAAAPVSNQRYFSPCSLKPMLRRQLLDAYPHEKPSGLTLSPRPLSRARKAWAALNISLGLVVMVAGFGSSLGELLAGAREGGLFAGQCKLTYGYAPQNPADPCNISGVAG